MDWSLMFWEKKVERVANTLFGDLSLQLSGLQTWGRLDSYLSLLFSYSCDLSLVQSSLGHQTSPHPESGTSDLQLVSYLQFPTPTHL